MSSLTRTMRRRVNRTHTEAQARNAYAAYRKTEEKPLSYRQWLAAQKTQQSA